MKLYRKVQNRFRISRIFTSFIDKWGLWSMKANSVNYFVFFRWKSSGSFWFFEVNAVGILGILQFICWRISSGFLILISKGWRQPSEVIPFLYWLSGLCDQTLTIWVVWPSTLFLLVCCYNLAICYR